MAGLWSSFSRLGLGDLDDMDLFEDKKKEEKAKAVPLKEEDFLLEKMVKCPICNAETPQKIMKTGKVKLLSTDIDLRPKYEHLDSVKYEVYQCRYCGYAALAKNYLEISAKQVEMIKTGICTKVVLHDYEGPIYTYEQALQRYQLALACAVVKKARASEKAYICLKNAWLMRGFAEAAQAEGNSGMAGELRAAEQEYLTKAFAGFSMAVMKESFPICGMPESTVDYLLAAIAFQLKRWDDSRKMIAKILQSPNATSRAKDKARFLKDEILAEVKKSKEKVGE